jgi:carboxymethylenebutenolidase
LQDYRLVELPRWAAWRGTEINPHPKHFPAPYQLSSHTIIAARQTGADVYPLTRALMRGCWVDELLDGAALLAAAESQAVADEMAANTDEALAAGAWSVPSFVVDGEIFFGQDRLEMIAWRLEGN